jgi:hypothetical protein
LAVVAVVAVVAVAVVVAMEMALATQTGLATGWAGLRRRGIRRADCFSLLA